MNLIHSVWLKCWVPDSVRFGQSIKTLQCIFSVYLLLQYSHKTFFLTFLAAFLTQTICLDDTVVKFEIWDTAGQERYHSLAPMYYRGAQAAIVMYDITNQVSELLACFASVYGKYGKFMANVTLVSCENSALASAVINRLV